MATAEHENDALLQATPDPGKVDLPGAKRTTKDSEPVDFMPKEEERPYSEAVTDEHRAFLKEHGVDLPEKKKKG